MIRRISSTIGTLDAPAALPGAMSSAAIHVTDPSLLYLDNVTFGMEFDGITGSQILLDNIEFSAIPEPSSVIMLLLGAGGMTVYRRLKVSGEDRLQSLR